MWAKPQGVNQNAKVYIKHQIIQFRKINIVEVDLFYFSHTIQKFNMTLH